MSATRYLLRTRYPKREGRKVLGLATGPRPPAYEEALLLEAGGGEPPDDAEPVLALTPRLRKPGRKATFELHGPLAAGARLERQGVSKFAFFEPDGRQLALIRFKYLPHRLRVEHRGGERLQLTNHRATKNPITALKRGASGGLLATWDGDDGLGVEVYATHGYALVDESRWPTDLRVALVAAMIGVEFSIDPSDLSD